MSCCDRSIGGRYIDRYRDRVDVETESPSRSNCIVVF